MWTSSIVDKLILNTTWIGKIKMSYSIFKHKFDTIIIADVDLHFSSRNIHASTLEAETYC